MSSMCRNMSYVYAASDGPDRNSSRPPLQRRMHIYPVAAMICPVAYSLCSWITAVFPVRPITSPLPLRGPRPMGLTTWILGSTVSVVLGGCSERVGAAVAANEAAAHAKTSLSRRRLIAELHLRNRWSC